jgi:hypothetical protein
LVLCEDTAYHNLLHARLLRLRDSGSLELKRCDLCKVVKPLSDFSPHRGRWDKRGQNCMPCDAERARRYRQQKQFQRASAFIV